MESSLKVSRAVTKCAFSKPFWGSLMLSLPISENNSIDTACTDGKNIWWNNEFVQKQDEEQTLGLMAHELGHIIFDHCQDWSPRDPKMCNVAMDIVINQMLLDDGFRLPDGGIQPEARFNGMTWQQVYEIIKDEEKYKEIAKELTIEDVLNDPSLSDSEKEQIRMEIEQKVIQAAENAKAQGVGTLPGGLEGLIKEIRTPKVNWKERIISTLKSNFPENYTMNRPNKKFLGSYGIYMPTMEGKRIGTLAVGVDSSGSMSDNDYIRILSELNSLSQELQIEKILVFYTDCEVAKVDEYDQGEVIEDLKPKGYGGTSFVPVFNYIYENGIEVDQLIYMTDMEVYDDCFPKEVPHYPVLWLSTRSDYNVPFGELIHVREDIK